MQIEFGKIGAIVVRLLVYWIPRDKHLIVYGGAMDYFIDNVKYLFIRHQETMPDYKHVWLTRRSSTYEFLSSRGFHVYYSNSLKGWYHLLRAGFFISDDYIDRYASHNCTVGAVRINLWHGIPFKMIGWIKADNEPAFQAKGWFWETFIAHHQHGDYCLSTSKSISRHFSAALHFPIENVYISGYPRTIPFFMDESQRIQFIQKYESEEMLDTYLRIKDMKCRKLMYMPTFRDKNVNYINEAIPSWEDLNEVLVQNNVCLYLKLHRMTPTPQNKMLSNIIVLDSSLDIYTLLPLFDGLISDYSSIMSDFGLLNRPVVLYTFDLEQYISQSRPVFQRFWDVYERLTILHNYEELVDFIRMKELPVSYFPVADYYECPQDMDATKRLINRLS